MSEDNKTTFRQQNSFDSQLQQSLETSYDNATMYAKELQFTIKETEKIIQFYILLVFIFTVLFCIIIAICIKHC